MKFLLCISAVMLGACLSGAATTSAEAYQREIKPLLQARCYACHGALKQKAGLRLDTGDAIRLGGKNGAVVLTNDISASPLLLRVASTNSDERMPPEGEPLTPAQVELLRAWIAQGAVSPSNEKADPDPREHWAFQRPVRPAEPAVKQISSGNVNPIDAFISAEHEKRGLTSQPEAPREILLRRVYLDLTGLPPTRDELRTFLADSAPDAYEKVVGRLIDSPRYGERWARHWMDIWRYADWYGRRHVPDVWNSAPQVWRWRDWMVRSLNDEKGYDQMLREMLAADEIAPEEDEARVATGYLVRNWYALNPNQWMRDTVEHTGKAFLGLTFNCAHCHDHKYDPITHKDYFQFRAFFEPLQVRQDRVPGEPDPGPFQKYEYSSNRKVVTNGMVSVFDENLEAKTYMYLAGDERNFPEGKPTVEPGMPAFLGGDSLKADRIDLPESASYPGVKPFIRQAEVQKHEQAKASAAEALAAGVKKLAEANARLVSTDSAISLTNRALAFTEVLAAEVALRGASNQLAVADSELAALTARIAADDARVSKLDQDRREAVQDQKSAVNNQQSAIDGNPPDDLAAVASRLERTAVLRKAQAKLAAVDGTLSLLQAEQAAAFARLKSEGVEEKKEQKDKAQAALKKAEEQLAAAQKALETAEAALQTKSAVYASLTPSYPKQSTGRRRALAEWITSRDNPLTARVAVNHIWARHFQAPLVASVFDFGRNGSPPTHPELLDWLAVELMEHDWSMKHLHRLIVTSRAYRQSSVVPVAEKVVSESNDETRNLELQQSLVSSAATNRERDPENKFLWRMNPGQMEAEVVRDSLLHLAGELDLTPVRYPLPTKDAETSHQRSLYFECFPEPGGHSQFASMFDPPEPMECYRRTKTIVPQQALALANSRLSREQSRALARRLQDQFPSTGDQGDADFVTAAFEQVLTRGPSAEELAACRDFLKNELEPAPTASTAGGTPEIPDAASNLLRVRARLVHALFNHNDFVTVR